MRSTSWDFPGHRADLPYHRRSSDRAEEQRKGRAERPPVRSTPALTLGAGPARCPGSREPLPREPSRPDAEVFRGDSLAGGPPARALSRRRGVR
jgi:hypothetical protein